MNRLDKLLSETKSIELGPVVVDDKLKWYHFKTNLPVKWVATWNHLERGVNPVRIYQFSIVEQNDNYFVEVQYNKDSVSLGISPTLEKAKRVCEKYVLNTMYGEVGKSGQT